MEPILVESVLLYITVRVEREDAAEECQEFRVDKKTGRYFRSFAAKSSIPFRVDKKIGWAYPEIHQERLMRCHRFIKHRPSRQSAESLRRKIG
jgi:hypothetical protein